MEHDIDLACTLTREELPGRREQWRRLLTTVTGVRRRPTGIELRFEPSDSTLEAVRSLAEAERECCSFLAWAVARSADEVVLDIAGPAGTEAMFDGWERDFRTSTAAGQL